MARSVAEQVLDDGYPFPREHRWWADKAEELARYVLVFLDELEPVLRDRRRAERLNGILRAMFRQRMREWARESVDYGYDEADVEQFLVEAEREADDWSQVEGLASDGAPL